MTGILLINKPPGPTSHDIVDLVRKLTGEKRVGHAGTLDPFAEGLLIVLVGRQATRRQSEFLTLPKVYKATIRLGATTDTYDRTGTITNLYYGLWPSEKKIKAVVESFRGSFLQTPPAYSAVKIKGRKAYQLARQGKEVKLKSRQVTIYEIEMLNYKPPLITILIKVSAGTYIRSLAADIGEKLGTGAFLEKLVRTRIGDFKLKDALLVRRLDLKTLKKSLRSVPTMGP